MEIRSSLAKLFVGMSTFAITCFCSATLQAQTINLSYNGAPDAEKNAVHLFASNLKAIVEQQSGGEMKIQLYPNSMLGEEQERMEQVINTPSLNIASFAGVSPLMPEIFVSASPFMLQSFEQARQFFDQGKYWENIQHTFNQKTSSHILAVVEEGGFLAFTNNVREIRKPDDFKGLKFRAMDQSQVALYEAFGASGTPIPWTEVYMALRTGVADGQMNPPAYIIMGSLNEVQKYMTLANIQYSDQFLIGNGKLMKSLSETDKKLLLDAIKEANDMNREAVQAQVQSRVDYLEKNGMQVYSPTQDELDAFYAIAQPSFIAWLEKKGINQKWIDLANSDLENL
ncbi:TRAP transporter substrate-binding protein DctP [Photobacterium sp. ZSDE20]|uniref:TRAP transporter substrate-binding protein DctP n=1 Tax=Photobacterium pectinilyticum TaxID=2906793 RepID=A0ABT1N1Q5_9GAMM|nr:TRAP transporter substrate-binding protein DctP [Photobacterium sp. ZSDE20]MCQ1058668.1 TRAP transporter substrate-binding protein DctP [Photobacterium sp. ZSDE20]MDD1823382.1 TRAP transporter substrate-binding protein DctP [Photobacterium sp. ZSDE20]